MLRSSVKSGDLITLLLCVLLGGALCVLYDLLRFFRKRHRPGGVRVFIEDVAFAAVAALLTFLLQLVRCSGELRWFVAVGGLTGFVLFRRYCSPWLLRILGLLLRITKALFSPILQLLRRIFSSIYKIIAKIYKKISVFLIFILKNVWYIIYNSVNRIFAPKTKRNDRIGKKKRDKR